MDDALETALNEAVRRAEGKMVGCVRKRRSMR